MCGWSAGPGATGHREQAACCETSLNWMSWWLIVFSQMSFSWKVINAVRSLWYSSSISGLQLTSLRFRTGHSGIVFLQSSFLQAPCDSCAVVWTILGGTAFSIEDENRLWSNTVKLLQLCNFTECPSVLTCMIYCTWNWCASHLKEMN